VSKVKNSVSNYIPYFIGAAISASFSVATTVHAQTKALEEVIVTAQKREQSVQEVPVAITALSQESLETNRVVNVMDLTGLAPNVTARPSAGGNGVASFSMRGVVSYGVVPGSDREVSIYIDGIYVGSPQGSIFNLPDIAQLEVLRGPQGTLFGRNATAGAINITTHDPAGEFGLRQDLSYGNHAYYRQRTSVDSPTWGPFSFAATYAKEKRQGDIKNLAAGTAWDRTAFGEGTAVSPSHLGDKDSESYFLAARFQPTDTFTMTLKADKNTDHGTPDATSPLVAGTVASSGSPAVAGIFAAQPENAQVNPNGLRPKAVNNAYAVPKSQSVVGESLTTMIDVNDHISVKNITGYRSTQVFAAVDITGFGALVAPAFFGPVAGSPLCLVCTQNETDSNQWSSELQVNYESDLLTLTVGALYFESEDRAGGPVNSSNLVTVAVLPNHVIPAGSQALSFNSAQSVAAFTQAEFHVTDTLDLLAGLRETRDRKSGDYRSGSAAAPTDVTFRYAKTTPSYMLGVNYKPTFDTLIYGKLSTAFVSGGSVGGVGFDPEKSKSWEAGIKSDFLNSKLRSNLSLFYTNYDNIQSSVSGHNVHHDDLGTLIVGQGPESAKGFEWEGSASVGYGITLNSSLGYTKIHFGDVNPVLQDSVQNNVPGFSFPNSDYLPVLSPEWTGGLGGQYESDPVFGQSYVSFSLGGTWHSKERVDPNSGRSEALPDFGHYAFVPASWVFNSRLALKKIDLGFGGAEGEVALWGRNLTDNRYPNYILNIGGLALGANYIEARSYGVDFTAKF